MESREKVDGFSCPRSVQGMVVESARQWVRFGTTGGHGASLEEVHGGDNLRDAGLGLHTLSIVRLRGGGRRAKGGRTQLCYCGLPSSNVVVLREVFEGPAAQWTLMCFFLESSSLLWAAGHAGRSRGAIWAIGVFVEALLGMVNFRGCWQAGGRLDSLLKGSWEAQVEGMCRPWLVRTRKRRTRRRMRVGRTAAAARGSPRVGWVWAGLKQRSQLSRASIMVKDGG